MLLPTQRYVLFGMNAFKAHSRMAFSGWAVDEVVSDDDGTQTKYRLHFQTQPEMSAIIHDDDYLGFGFVDLYGTAADARQSVEDRITFYSEDDIQQVAEAAQSEDQVVHSLVLVGLSATCQPDQWKHTFITGHMEQGSPRVRMTAILAAVLTTHAAYAEPIRAVVRDEDQTLSAYARDMLESVQNAGGVD